MKQGTVKEFNYELAGLFYNLATRTSDLSHQEGEHDTTAFVTGKNR